MQNQDEPRHHLAAGSFPHTCPVDSLRGAMWEKMIPLMVQKSGDHQLRLVVYPIIHRALYISGG